VYANIKRYLKNNQPIKHSPKIRKAVKQLAQLVSMTKWKPFEEFFKNKNHLKAAKSKKSS
jgi:hypothetical protein